jgi:regulator of nonsense transcripts 2
MKTQQQAEKEEQQRIKNLVLNYDLRENDDQDGDTYQKSLLPNANIHQINVSGHEKPPSYHPNRLEKPGKERGGQRVRRLQLSDVDWYDRPHQNESTPLRAKANTQPAEDVCNEDGFAPNSAPYTKALDKRQVSLANRRNSSQHHSRRYKARHGGLT